MAQGTKCSGTGALSAEHSAPLRDMDALTLRSDRGHVKTLQSDTAPERHLNPVRPVAPSHG
jgi:hypothetical protein